MLEASLINQMMTTMLEEMRVNYNKAYKKGMLD